MRIPRWRFINISAPWRTWQTVWWSKSMVGPMRRWNQKRNPDQLPYWRSYSTFPTDYLSTSLRICWNPTWRIINISAPWRPRLEDQWSKWMRVAMRGRNQKRNPGQLPYWRSYSTFPSHFFIIFPQLFAQSLDRWFLGNQRSDCTIDGSFGKPLASPIHFRPSYVTCGSLSINDFYHASGLPNRFQMGKTVISLLPQACSPRFQ
jgi:hypothetical protein